MKKDKEYIGYEEALTDNEILLFSKIILEFKNGGIDLESLKNIFLNKGITVEPIYYDICRRMITVMDANNIKKRILEGKSMYNDIDYFILNSNDFNNVVFRLDYKAIEVLANYGIPEFQNTLISILKWQLVHSCDKDKEISVRRSRWRRRIQELESLLKKQDCIVKTK